MTAKIRVAWFSDLPVSEEPGTISSYVSRLLLPHLRERFSIDLFHNSFRRFEDYPTFHCLTAIRRHRENPYDVFFYQLEDNPRTQWVRIHCGLMPGVQLGHDFLYTSFGPEPILNSPWHTILKKVDDATIAWPVRTDEQFQQGPHAIREASYAAVRLFSQPGMLSECNRLVKQSISMQDGVPTAFLPVPVNSELFSLALPSSSIKQILFCGSPWVQHRGHKLFAAIAQLDRTLPVQWLVDESERTAAESLVAEFDLSQVTIVCGRSAARWEKLIAQGGVAVHTMFSVFGQSEPYLAMSMAAGLPCLVSNFGHSEYLPDSVVFKIQPGETEATEIAAVLRLIIIDRTLTAAELSREFARELHSAELVADELASVFEQQLESITLSMARWQEFKATARRVLIAEAQSMAPDCGNEFGASDLLASVYREFEWM